MSINSGSTAHISPDILCVSNSQNTNRNIRTAVARHRPNVSIETTTDPTVVAELVRLWDLSCVVADADMDPLDGFELKSSLQTDDRQLSVLVVSTEPADGESTVSLAAADETDEFAVCLEQAVPRQDLETTPDSKHYQPASQLKAVIDADSRHAVVAELEKQLAALASVRHHQIWLTTVDGSLEATTATDGHCSAVRPAVREAVETGEPQWAAEPTDGSTVTDQTDTPQRGVYPLGSQGAIVVEYDVFTPAVAASVHQLASIGGGCLDHHAAITNLEARFRQTAERNRQLLQFARTVAHDLNSPLSVIYGRIELVLANQSDAEMHLQAAHNAVQRIDSLITDHLQTIETTDAEGDREDVSVQTMAIQAWRIVDPSTARLQVEPQLETVEANAIRLQQLFENLIRNAIQHGSEESVGLASSDSQDPHAVFDDDTDSVTVTIKPTESGFAVCDDGPGIRPEERETIFESGYTTTDSGSGLGLHIVSEIVSSHDWEITVTESASGGARFEINTE